mmetsp:Transcript_56636/g.89973  ORF Transcript_56636/g.89973 Transcript_56636/m.89973 type:complete len:619 (-) Transcript_56636:249-2105(-)
MPIRENLPSSISTGVIALSSIAVVALIWSISCAEEKQRKRRRNGEEDENDETSFNKGGADVRVGANGKSSLMDCSRKVSDATVPSSLSLGTSNSASSWSASRATGASPWLSGVSGFSPHRQASMSANEKRELDMMFRHQERQDTRGPSSIVDSARAKHATRRRRGVSRGNPTSGILGHAVGSEEEHLAEKLAEELLAEEASHHETPASPGRAKKSKQKKPRKRNKARNAESNTETHACDISDDECPHIDNELLDNECIDDCDIEVEGTQDEQTAAADFADSASEQEGKLEEVIEELPSASVEQSTSSVISSPGQNSCTSSTGHGSEAGDGDIGFSETAVIEAVDQVHGGLSMRHEPEAGDGDRGSSETAVMEPVDGILRTSSPRKELNIGDSDARFSENASKEPVDGIHSSDVGSSKIAVRETVDEMQGTPAENSICHDLHEPADSHRVLIDSTLPKRAPRPVPSLYSRPHKHRSWADVTDASDDESMGAWLPLGSNEQKPSCEAAVSSENPGAHLLRILRGDITSDVTSTGPTEIISADSGTSYTSNGNKFVDDIATGRTICAASNDALDIQPKLAKADTEVVSSDSMHSLTTAGAPARPGWVQVATRQRARKGAKS